MRITCSRDAYKPKDAIEIKAPDSSAVAYLGSSRIESKPDLVVACGFSGKRNKPDFHYRFGNEAKAREHIARHADGVKRSEQTRAEWKAARLAAKCSSTLAVWEKARLGEYLTASDVAICLRAELARKFPGVKFSVRSGNGLNVYWTDGPEYGAVSDLARDYAFAGFDGMIDLRYSIKRWLCRDGSISLAHSQGTQDSRGTSPEYVGDPHSPDAVLASATSDFVFTHRELSQGVKLDLARLVCARFGIAMPETFSGDNSLDRFLNTTIATTGDYLSNLVWRASNGALD